MLINPLPAPHVLIIDDDPDISSVLASALEAVGCKVSVESRSDRAEEACRKANPDLILIDMMMPGRTGIDLLGPLHEIAPDAIMCITTGMGDPALLQRSLKSGAWNVLCKPYSLTELTELIDLALKLSQSLREEAGAGVVESQITQEFSGDHKPTPADLASLIAVAAGAGIGSDIAYRKLPLLASELLDNAFEHGTQQDPNAKYGTKLVVDDNDVELTVWDSGKSFDGKTVIRQQAFAVPKGKLSGLQLASALADEVRFSKEPNAVTLVWHENPLKKDEEPRG